MKSRENILWIDLEMTGIKSRFDRILEIACIVTDKDLNTLAIGPDLAIKTSKLRLKFMDEWNQEHHKTSGLIERISKEGVTLKDAESQILEFINQYCEEGKTVIAGNSIHVDRRFIKKYMPRLDKYLHYRMIDVSSVRELSQRWYPEFEEYPSGDSHRALDDIQVSIDMLKYIRKNVFK